MATALSCLFLLSHNDAIACYCTSPWTIDPNTGTSYCTVNPECWACAPGAYDPNWQRYYCTNYTPAPPPAPTCQTSVESQTVSCPSGYTGELIQTRTSTCPNPQGSAVFGPWTTSSDSCVKSINNPMNPASPVSVIAPPPSPPVTSSTPATTSAEQAVQSLMSAPVQNTGSETQEQKTEQPAPKGLGTGLKLVQRLETLGVISASLKPQMLPPGLDISTGVPDEYRRQQDFFLDLISNNDGHRALSSDQRARFGGILWSNPLQSGYGSD